MLDEAKRNQILETLPDERLAIAFSGGGDSTALVHMARTLNPKPLILIVDHGLRLGSDEEAQATQSFAQGLGLEARLLTWKHNNPETGLQEKARRARYGLMGQVCREVGIRYLLTGHTQDDQAETLFMRYEKGTGWRGAAGMAEYSYAPVWPELAEVTIVRPLLQVSRENLRAYNRRCDLPWAEDPSNKNETFDRIRTRHYLAGRPRMSRQLLMAANQLRKGVETEKLYLQKFLLEFDETGIVYAKHSIPLRLLQFILMVASGSNRMVSQEQLTRLKNDLADKNFKSATMGGTRIYKHKNEIQFGPELAIYRGRNNKKPIETTRIESGDTKIWSGRYRIDAKSDAVINSAVNKTPRNSRSFDYAIPFAIKGEIEIKSLVEERLNGLLGNFV